MKELKCPICGEPTSVWYGNARKDRLCRHHAEMLKNGELTKCEDCGEWYIVKEGCKCKNQGNNIEVQTNKCIICGTDSGNYKFCKKCFAEYHGKTLLMQIKVAKDEEIKVLNESYEGIYECKDGHVVKSKSEREIDNYLFENKIAHAYEKPLIIKGEIFKPDFFLPDLNVYIEHWGYDENNKEYTQRKEYKLKKYSEEGITLISTYEATDTKNIEVSLALKLSKYENGKINF